MLVKVGTVIENAKWKIKVFAPPKEHGPPHVHVISKGDKAEVKISLVNLEVIGGQEHYEHLLELITSKVKKYHSFT